MAQLALTTSIKSDGTSVYIDDATTWDATDPRNNVALMGLVEKIHSNEPSSILKHISEDIDYSPSYDNSYRSRFEFAFEGDGGHNCFLLRFPVSPDGLTIPDEAYYYNIVDFKLYQRDSVGGDREITDYAELIDTTNIHRPIQEFVNTFWTPQLSIKESALYNEYRVARENCANEDKLLDSMLELNINLEHALALFEINMKMEAESIIESLLIMYEI